MNSDGAPETIASVPHERPSTQSNGIPHTPAPTLDLAALRVYVDEFLLRPGPFLEVAEAFLGRVGRLRERAGPWRSGFEREYHEIRQTVEGAPGYENLLTPQTRTTMALNRYRDVLPLERTRVRLQDCRDLPGGDYINANFIGEHFISTCAPIPPAMTSFWRMVWENDVHAILMLTNFIENDKRKAEPYWREGSRQPVDYQGVVVACLEEQLHPEVVGIALRQFEIWRREAPEHKRIIRQVQLTNWPDHGVLGDFRPIAPLLELVNAARDAGRNRGHATTRSPILVHCSAGIGRSGTFIAIDLILKKLYAAFRTLRAQSESGESPTLAVKLFAEALDIRQVVFDIRSQRPGMVQTPEQYEMIYDFMVAVIAGRRRW